MANKEIPVYLFVGFLESGKTKFIEETLADPRFDGGNTTLLLVCEEGENEYDPSKFAFDGVVIRTLEDKSELNEENLTKICDECGADRVVIEYNGMWLDSDLTANIPENWLIYQTVCCVDGTTFRSYFENMRQLMLDKFAVSELIVVNRADSIITDSDKEYVHKCVRQANRRADIAYEFKNGYVAYDDIPDELPFDVNADVIEVNDDDFGLWYMDVTDNPQKYHRKKIRFTVQVCQSDRVPKGQFIAGRFAMTCCVEDIQFVGFPCKYDKASELKSRDFVKITALINIKFHPLFNCKCPVLTTLELEPTEAPQSDYVMFS